jgi:hypothetical protein
VAKLAAKLPFKLGGPTSEQGVFRMRLLSTRSPEAYAEDLEYNLRGVAQILGGNAYSGGMPVSYAGAVSIAEHLRPGSKIGVASRSEPYGYVALTAAFGGVNRNDMRVHIPGASSLGEHVPVSCAVYFSQWQGAGSGTLTGDLKVSTTSGSYLATASTSISVNPGVVTLVPVGPVGPAPGTGADDRITVEFTRTDANGTLSPIGLAVTLHVKAKHVA